MEALQSSSTAVVSDAGIMRCHRRAYLHLTGVPRVLDRLDLADVRDAPVKE